MHSNGANIQAPVVAGILCKYANMAKGWRDRLFVLADGKLVYYKVSGSSGVNVHQVLQHYSSNGTRQLGIIGGKTAVLQKRDQEISNNGLKRTSRPAPQIGSPPPPTGAYAVQGARLRESNTERHKFYIHCKGNPVITVKCEAPDDRVAWLAALSGARLNGTDSTFHTLEKLKGAKVWTGPDADSALPQLLQTLASQHQLSEDGCALVRTHMRSVINQVHKLRAELARSQNDTRELAEEKRVLETRLIAETQQTTRASDRSSSSSLQQPEEADDVDDDSLAGVEYDSEPESLGGTVHDVGGDLFYDAREVISSSRGRRSQSDDSISGERVTARAGALASSTRAAVPSSRAPERAAELAKTLPRPDWTQQEGAAPKRRDRLPPPMEEERSVSLWSIIKECIGKDLTRICLPVFFNEPLSALQKMAEEFEYSNLLDYAATAPRGSPQRMQWMAVFAISGYSGTKGRTCKPFNPLLGETYEYVDGERGVRFIAEKVVHHPTILAGHAEGRAWTLAADLEAKSKFWGRCIELKPLGRIEVRFADGEVITWNKVVTTINNLIMGKLYIEHGGTMRVTSSVCPLEARVKFKNGGVLARSKNEVVGAMYDGSRELPGFSLEGCWDDRVVAEMGPGQPAAEVWRKAPAPPDPTRYNLTSFAITLNELTAGLRERLAPTDCRLRPDQAALEKGQYDLANAEKQRLEKKQRAARKAAEEGVPIRPRWFTERPDAQRGEQLAFEYAGGYWESRAAGKYADCRDIFGE